MSMLFTGSAQEKPELLDSLDLFQTLKLPKMCGDVSKFVDLEEFPEYRRGRDALPLTATDIGIASDIGKLNNGQDWMFENGTFA